MGMTELQILFRVEVPNGLQVMFGGLRAAALQVIATVVVVAVLNLGGFGRYLMQGTAIRDYGLLLGAAVCIALLAIVVDAALAAVQKAVVSPGLKTVPGGKS
jgi:osmoprotectant transport system permease protein